MGIRLYLCGTGPLNDPLPRLQSYANDMMHSFNTNWTLDPCHDINIRPRWAYADAWNDSTEKRNCSPKLTSKSLLQAYGSRHEIVCFKVTKGLRSVTTRLQVNSTAIRPVFMRLRSAVRVAVALSRVFYAVTTSRLLLHRLESSMNCPAAAQKFRNSSQLVTVQIVYMINSKHYYCICQISSIRRKIMTVAGCLGVYAALQCWNSPPDGSNVI